VLYIPATRNLLPMDEILEWINSAFTLYKMIQFIILPICGSSIHPSTFITYKNDGKWMAPFL